MYQLYVCMSGPYYHMMMMREEFIFCCCVMRDRCPGRGVIVLYIFIIAVHTTHATTQK